MARARSWEVNGRAAPFVAMLLGLCVLAGLVAPARAEGPIACVAADFVHGELRADGVRKRLVRAQAIHILAIGSSSTQGVGASSRDASYPARLENDLRAAWPGRRIQVENAGIGGETAAATLNRLEARLATVPYDLVIWQVGTNDALATGSGDTAAFRAMLKRGIAAARAARTEIALLDPQYFPGIRNVPAYERFVAAVAEVAGEERVPVVRRYDLMKRWASGDGSMLLAALSGDRFHMGDTGYACLARLVAGQVTAAVGPAGSVPVAGVAGIPGGS